MKVYQGERVTDPVQLTDALRVLLSTGGFDTFHNVYGLFLNRQWSLDVQDGRKQSQRQPHSQRMDYDRQLWDGSRHHRTFIRGLWCLNRTTKSNIPSILSLKCSTKWSVFIDWYRLHLCRVQKLPTVYISYEGPTAKYLSILIIARKRIFTRCQARNRRAVRWGKPGSAPGAALPTYRDLHCGGHHEMRELRPHLLHQELHPQLSASSPPCCLGRRRHYLWMGKTDKKNNVSATHKACNNIY